MNQPMSEHLLLVWFFKDTPINLVYLKILCVFNFKFLIPVKSCGGNKVAQKVSNWMRLENISELLGLN